MFLRPSPVVITLVFSFLVIIGFTLLLSVVLISKDAAAIQFTSSVPEPRTVPVFMVETRMDTPPQPPAPQPQVNTNFNTSANIQKELPQPLLDIAAKTLVLVDKGEFTTGFQTKLKEWANLGFRVISIYPTDDPDLATTLTKEPEKANITAFGLQEKLIRYIPIPGNLTKSHETLAMFYATFGTASSFDWIVKITPKTMLREQFLLALLARHDPRQPLLLGLPDPRPVGFQPLAICASNPGYIISQALLQSVGTSLLECFQKIPPTDTEEPVLGECLQHFAPPGYSGCIDGEGGKVGWTRFLNLDSGERQGDWWRDVDLRVGGRIDAAVLIGGSEFW